MIPSGIVGSWQSHLPDVAIPLSIALSTIYLDAICPILIWPDYTDHRQGHGCRSHLQLNSRVAYVYESTRPLRAQPNRFQHR